MNTRRIQWNISCIIAANPFWIVPMKRAQYCALFLRLLPRDMRPVLAASARSA